jgi:hypothetical protein
MQLTLILSRQLCHHDTGQSLHVHTLKKQAVNKRNSQCFCHDSFATTALAELVHLSAWMIRFPTVSQHFGIFAPLFKSTS